MDTPPDSTNSHRLPQTLDCIASYYNGCKVGYVGNEGYRKSTDLDKLSKCVDEMVALDLIHPQQTVFLDLGCGDGRVNVLMSYFVKRSLGIELDREIFHEFKPRKAELDQILRNKNLIQVPETIDLFIGDSLKNSTYERIEKNTGIRFQHIDLFYTYITLHDLFAAKIARGAKNSALYLVYGFNKVLPRYQGLDLLIPDVASQGIVALYSKNGACT
jgi:hypothetical protein